MADSHGAEAHHGPTAATYTVIFIALCVFTTVSFAINYFLHDPHNPNYLFGVCVIVVAAVCKAFLVGLIFMHLRYDWDLLYYLIVPALILGVMMMIVLMPDIVLAWQPPEY
jgi:caa(3)-type oxidase subunit IV